MPQPHGGADVDWVPHVSGFVDLRWCGLRKGTIDTAACGWLRGFGVATYGLMAGGLGVVWLGWVFKGVPSDES